jgi:hypothetical protein
VVTVHRLGGESGPAADRDLRALRRLAVGPGQDALYLVRPDGHIGYRSTGADVTGLESYLRRWLPSTGT